MSHEIACSIISRNQTPSRVILSRELMLGEVCISLDDVNRLLMMDDPQEFAETLDGRIVGCH
ncbi:MAG: hypothetical protein ACI8P0_003059 [Planctomycetaceae bacterium]|jgi:hypothetical protein